MQRIDLRDDDSTAQLAALPRFRLADQLCRRHLILIASLAGVSILLMCSTAITAEPLLKSVLAIDAAALLLAAASLLSGYWVAKWRDRALNPMQSAKRRLRPRKKRGATEASEEVEARFLRWWNQFSSRFLAKLGTQGIESACLTGLSTLGLAIVLRHSDSALSGAALGSWKVLAGGSLGLLTFGLLVLERDFARYQPSEWPEATSYSYVCRLAVAALLLSDIAVLIDSPTSVWAPRLAFVTALFPLLLATEFLVRTGISLFSSKDEQLEPQLLARSSLGAFITWPPPSLDRLQQNLKERFGIDLRQNWAFSFVRRASLPVLLGTCLVGWLLTGVSELPPDRRGVYEVFGKPRTVVGPGLHAGLPWPLSQMRSVENGVVHEIATTLPSEGATASESSGADDRPPVSVNRLWDASHVAEKSLLIASQGQTAQGFQIVNMDVRFFYRIALTPEGAMRAAYQTSDLPSLLRSTASRVLVTTFASRTLDGVLGEERLALSRLIGESVQQHMDNLNSGVEILATVVEAIHPPAGAADAYHSVQAAQIASEASISRQRGEAATTTNGAREEATLEIDSAAATGRETLDAARAVASRFKAEERAYRTAGNAFMFEYYLSQVALGLGMSQVTIVDHRIGNTTAPTIDLRRYGPPGYYPER
jgi:regulator of protease activity HflC (stomatin/prohibitin superfamily)